MSDCKEWNVRASNIAQRTHNPIRKTLDRLAIKPDPNKPLIPLSIGDPTIFGNLKTPQCVVDIVKDVVESYEHNGYVHSAGDYKAREAVAKQLTHPEAPVTAEDVSLACGCSGALELAIVAIASEGQNVLVPLPGFPIYSTIAEGRGVMTKQYRLLPERGWEADIEHMSSLIDEKTAAIIVNNPSNPCGTNWSKQHLQEILAVAGQHRVPIISDEVYDGMVFPPNVFHPLATLSRDVPILTCGGLAKKYLVPGWRVGWVVVHDRHTIFGTEVRGAINALTQVLLGPNTLIQGALPEILEGVQQNYCKSLLQTLAANARFSFEQANKIPGLHPHMPQGAMYMMIGLKMDHFPEFENDMDFVQALITEQSVFCLPGECFSYPNYIRVVITLPTEKLKIAYERIGDFCAQHYRP